MSDLLRKYERLQKRIEKAQRDLDHARWGLTREMERLKKEHNCHSVDEAKALARRLGKKRIRLEGERESFLQQIERKYPHVFGSAETNSTGQRKSKR